MTTSLIPDHCTSQALTILIINSEDNLILDSCQYNAQEKLSHWNQTMFEFAV